MNKIMTGLALTALLAVRGAMAALPPFETHSDETFDPVKAGWKCVFEDEFEGTVLDTNKWYRPHFCRKGMRIEPDGKGHLVFHMKKDETGKLPNGYVYSTAEETYGYYEARVRFTADDGWWAASWIYAGSAGNPFLDGMEIDTFEDFYLRLVDGHFLRDRIASSIHCTLAGKVTSFQQHYAVPGDLKGWHRIACKWDPLLMSFYLDGRLVAAYSAFNTVACIRPLHAILSAERRRGDVWLGGVARDGTQEGVYEIDYVRIWKDPNELKGVKVAWTGGDADCVFAPTGSVAKLTVAAKSDFKDDPIDQIYLFDNGFPIGATFEFPHTYRIPMTEEFFRSVDYGHFRLRPQDGPERPFDGYPHTFVAFARTKSGRVGRTEPVYRIPVAAPTARPYEGQAATVPGTVTAWKFDEGGQDVAYHTNPPKKGKKEWRPTQARPSEALNNTRDSVSGFAGAWVNYTVDVAKTADYDATFYYGTAIRSANSAVLLVDGAVAGEFAWPAGTGYSWSPTDTSKATVRLTQGRHVLTVLFRSQVSFGKLVFAERKGMRTERLLNDGWSGTMTSADGLKRELAHIVLPHNWDDYYGHRQMFHGDLHGTATYRRTFTAAKRAGERQFLVFDGAGTFLTVRLNGRELCTRRHAGRLVTTLEATDALKDGANAIEVVCDHPKDIPNTPWLCGGCGFCTCESPEPFGLCRRVRLVTTGAARVAPWGLHVWHDGACRTAFVETEVDFGPLVPEGLKLRVRSEELGIDATFPCRKTVRGEFPLKDVVRWSPKNPKLYSVTAEIVGADGAVVDAETVRTGFNTLRWPIDKSGDHRFLLNGEPLFVHGTAETDHRLGDRLAFDDEEIDARIAEVKRVGFNIFREGHEPHDLRYLQKMEEAGLMSWAGFSTRNYTDTEEFRANFMACVEQWVKERRNSPAVVIWGLQNESDLPVEFTRACRERIRALDPLSGPQGRPVVTCNGGEGSDWNVIQNWSGTYAGHSGKLMTYETDLAKPNQLLNGEYGAWRVSGWHSDPDEPFDIDGPWTEEHQARILYEKLMRGWKAREKVCGHLLWTFFSHCNPGRTARVEEAYREIDKTGPVNMKGLYTLGGRRVEAWYLYFAFGHHLNAGTVGAHVDKTLSWWLKEGHRLAEMPAAAPLGPEPLAGKVYVQRLNCGGDAVTDSLGNRWMADDTRYVRSWSQDDDMQIKGYGINPVLGSQDTVPGGVLNAAPADQELFGTFRYGRMRQRFTLPAPSNATCTVEMYFVEPGSYGRLFDIAINGRVVAKRFRLADCAGDRSVVCRRFEVRTGAKPEIEITFPRVYVNQALVSAIAVATDAESAKRMPAEARKPGYPASDGLTWKELSQRVRHNTPFTLLPLGGKAAQRTRPPRAMPYPDKDGYHCVLFQPYVAGQYAIRFHVVKGNPVGKKVRWKVEGEYWNDYSGDLTIKVGETVLAGPVSKDGTIDMPMDVFLNAGGYFVYYQIEDDSLSARIFVQ